MAALQSRPHMQFGSLPASPTSPSRTPDQNQITVFVPGSAEFLANRLQGGLNCGHFPKYRVDPDDGRYPSRLGFFHESNSDGRFSVLETTRLCPSCLDIAIPETFNFWSLAQASATQSGWLKQTPTEQTYPQVFLVGKEGFPPSSPSARRSLQAAVPLRALFIPDVPNAREAWNWLRMERKPFYIDQLHIIQGWSSLREKPAAVDSRIVGRIGIAFVPAPPPTQLEALPSPLPNNISAGNHTADQISSKVPQSAEGSIRKAKKTSSRAKKGSSSKDSTRPNSITSNTIHSVESNNALLLSETSSSPMVMQSSGPRKSKRTKSQRPEVTSLVQPDAEITNNSNTIGQEAKMTGLDPNGTSSSHVSSHVATSPPVSQQPATKIKSASTSKITHVKKESSLSKPPAAARSTSTPVMLSSELGVSTDQQLATLVSGTAKSENTILSSTTHIGSESTFTKTKKENGLVRFHGKATSVSEQYTINWGRHDPIPFDSSAQMPSLFDYGRRAENKGAIKSLRTPLPLEELLKKDKTFSPESSSHSQDLMCILDSGASASKKKRAPVSKASADFIESIFAVSGRPSDGKPLMNGPSISEPPKPKASERSKQKDKKEKEGHKTESKLDKGSKKTKSGDKSKIRGEKASREKRNSDKAASGHGSGSGGKSSDTRNKSSNSHSSSGFSLPTSGSGGSKQKASSHDSGLPFGSGKGKKSQKKKSHKDSSDSSSESNDEKPHGKKKKKPSQDKSDSSSESDYGHEHDYSSSYSEPEGIPVPEPAQPDTSFSEDEISPSAEPAINPPSVSTGGDLNIAAIQINETEIYTSPSTTPEVKPDPESQPTNPNTNPWSGKENGTVSEPSAAFPNEQGPQSSPWQENKNDDGSTPSQMNKMNPEAPPVEVKPNPSSQPDSAGTNPQSDKPMEDRGLFASQPPKTGPESSFKSAGPSATSAPQQPSSKAEAPVSQPNLSKTQPSLSALGGSQGASSAKQPGNEPAKSSARAISPNKPPGPVPDNSQGGSEQPTGQENGDKDTSPVGTVAAGAAGVVVGAAATAAVMDALDDDDVSDHAPISKPSYLSDYSNHSDDDSQEQFDAKSVSSIHQDQPWSPNNYESENDASPQNEDSHSEHDPGNWANNDPYYEYQDDYEKNYHSDAGSHATSHSDDSDTRWGPSIENNLSDMDELANNTFEAGAEYFGGHDHQSDRDSCSPSSESPHDGESASGSENGDSDKSDQSNDDSDHDSDQESHESSDESSHSISASEQNDQFELDYDSGHSDASMEGSSDSDDGGYNSGVGDDDEGDYDTGDDEEGEESEVEESNEPEEDDEDTYDESD